MTPQELIVRMTLYRKEIIRRGIILLLCVFLPGCAAIFMGGMLLGLPFSGIWQTIAFAGIIFLFILFNFTLYIYMIWKSLPKKLDLLCPTCGALIIDTDAKKLMEAGTCYRCGGVIVTLPPRAE